MGNVVPDSTPPLSQVRPFGAAVMVGSWTSSEGAQLFCIEPSGVHYGYWGCSAGKARQAAKTEIEKLKTKDMTCKELLKEAAKIIYQVCAVSNHVDALYSNWTIQSCIAS